MQLETTVTHREEGVENPVEITDILTRCKIQGRTGKCESEFMKFSSGANTRYNCSWAAQRSRSSVERKKKERKDMTAAKYNAFDCRLAAENSLPLAPAGR